MIVIFPNRQTKLLALNWNFENADLWLDRLQNFNFKVSKLVCLFGDMTIPSSSSDYFLLLYLCQNWALSQNKAIVIIASGLQSELVSHPLLLKDFEITKKLRINVSNATWKIYGKLA